MSDARCDGAASLSAFLKPRPPKLPREVCSMAVVQIATEDSSDEGSREVVEFFKQLSAKVAAMSSKKMRHLGRAGA